MKVPFFDYPRLYTDNKKEFDRIFSDVCSRGAFILQQDVKDFEASLAHFTSARYAIGVGNATDGLEMCWMSIGLRPGDEVIVSSHTMLATASAIRLAGGTPVPVEIGDDNLIDPQAVEDAINSRTVGVMPTDLNGRTCDMQAIMNIAEKHKLYVVEDAAQALGSKFKGKHAGTFGHASAISFFPAKVLGCFGDAGAVITNSEQAFETIYQLHDHGRDPAGNVKSWGRNSRLDNLHAAFLNNGLSRYSDVINRRRTIAELYHQNLCDIEELSLPPGPTADSDHFDIYQNYEILALRRDELKEFLYSKGVGTLIQWGGKGVHQWERLGFPQILPKVEYFFRHSIMLPINMFVSDEDVTYVCEKIRSFYGEIK